MQMIQQSLVTLLMITISFNRFFPYIKHALLAPLIYKNLLFFLLLLSPSLLILSLLTLHLLFHLLIFLALSSLLIHQIPPYYGSHSHSLTKFVNDYLLSLLDTYP